MDIDNEISFWLPSNSGNGGIQPNGGESMEIDFEYMSNSRCAICGCYLMGLCAKCQTPKDRSINGICTVAWGECNHVFHYHCIFNWLKIHSSCPLDQRQWAYKKYT